MLLVDLYPTFFWFNDSYVVLKYFNFFIMKCLHNVILFITLYIWMQVLLLEALKANRCDYVRVLLDRGVHLKMINLPELYEQVNVCTILEFLMHFFKFPYIFMVLCFLLDRFLPEM